MIEIKHKGLTLVPLNFEKLYIWKNEGRQALEQSMGLLPKIHDVGPLYESETQDALENFWLPHTKENPQNFEWYTNWEIIDKSLNCSVGGIGFGGFPADGSCPVGYLIYPEFRQQGIATAALQALCNWAFLHPHTKCITAETPEDNVASQKVLMHCGFEQSSQAFGREGLSFKLIAWQKANPFF